MDDPSAVPPPRSPPSQPLARSGGRPRPSVSPPLLGLGRAGALCLLAIAAALPARAAPSKLALTPCRLKGGVQADCGTLDVPEDRRNPAGRHLKLKVAVIPALARATKPDPLFMLAGGPGQAATEAIPELVQYAFERVHRSRDIVLVDQRGTGSSGPLKCKLSKPGTPLAERLSEVGYPKGRLQECLKGYDADPRLYTTSIAMQDLDEVREALGYAQINLWGGSYGTRASLIYLREHPQRVRAVILDGVAPPTMRLPLHFAEDAQRSMDLLFANCAAEPSCAKAWPDLPARFKKLIDSLGQSPVRTTVADPTTGEKVEVTITRDLFTSVLRAVLYQPWQASLVPLIVGRAEAGDFAPLVALGSSWSEGLGDSMALGMMLSVLCTEDISRFTDQDLAAHTKETFLGATIIQSFKDGCAVWPKGEAAAGFGEPVTSDKPVLLLSGELDPVTPPGWADEAKKTLSHSVHFTVPGVGHGASAVGCVPKLISEFLDKGATDGLDGACVGKQKRPPFFVTFAGPTP
jgi:pimeloyl-ACP methyl ester carboxylesterase